MITSVYFGNERNYTYVYDKLGQLIRVNDPNDTTSGSTGTTWTYEYDRGGNLLQKKRYAYTSFTLGTVLQTISYTYGDSTWKDKMTAYNGQPISYDAIGNPLSDGEWNYQWEQGHRLWQMYKDESGQAGSVFVDYGYNADGLRISKQVLTYPSADTTSYISTDYTWHGKNIVHMTQDGNNLHFFYDASSHPALVEFNGTKYAYIHNLQGDIVGIVDSNGTEIVKYTYDSWGKLLSTTGSLALTLGKLNPFRYRGYVYDEETGLYYLRSRYYNPTWGRFVNADSQINLFGRKNDCNVFCYCTNAPLLKSDPSGKAPLSLDESPWYRAKITALQTPLCLYPSGYSENKVWINRGEKVLYRNTNNLHYYEVRYHDPNGNVLRTGYVYALDVDNYYDNRILDKEFSRFDTPSVFIDPSCNQPPITYLQHMLNLFIEYSDAEIDKLKVDGYYGEETQTAVMLFRELNPQVNYGDEYYVGYRTLQSLYLYVRDGNTHQWSD